MFVPKVFLIFFFILHLHDVMCAMDEDKASNETMVEEDVNNQLDSGTHFMEPPHSGNGTRNSSHSSHTSSTSTVENGKNGKKKKVTKTVVTEVEEEETSAEKREKAEREAALTRSGLQLESNESKPVPPLVLLAPSSKVLRDAEQLMQLQRQQSTQENMQRLKELSSGFLDDKNGRIKAEEFPDFFPACDDMLPADVCNELKPLCNVSDTARAIRFLRERSDYLLFLGNDLQSHINFVKATMLPTNPYALTLHQSLDNIANLLPSMARTAPLLQMILNEDSEEELEQILNAHLRFKQECEEYEKTCKRQDIVSYKRDRACHQHAEICCCDGLKFQQYYQNLMKPEPEKQCAEARALRKSTRRLVESVCANTCKSCPTRFRAKEYAQELVECDRNAGKPKHVGDVNAYLEMQPAPIHQIPIPPAVSDLVNAQNLIDHYRQIGHQLRPDLLLVRPEQRQIPQPSPSLQLQLKHVPMKFVPLQQNFLPYLLGQQKNGASNSNFGPVLEVGDDGLEG